MWRGEHQNIIVYLELSAFFYFMLKLNINDGYLYTLSDPC